MAQDSGPVRWRSQRAVVTLPEHVDVSNAAKISDELLSVINRGATELIVDMTATLSCDYAGADALVRAYHRAAASGTQLRLVVTAPIVRRVLAVHGLDRLIPVYPSVEAATAAGTPATVVPLVPGPGSRAGAGQQRPGHAARPRRQPGATGPHPPPRTTAVTRAVLLRLLDALADGVVLADDDGTVALVNRRTEDMFGYERGELAGCPVESLVPADLRAAHRRHRADYARAPRGRPMGAGARLVGLRKDGSTFPVEVSLSPVLTATGHLTLAVIRDVAAARPGEDLADLARAVVAAEEAHLGQELLDSLADSLFDVGLSLEEATGLPAEVARQRIITALQRLDDAIREIRDHVFAACGQRDLPGPGSPDGAQ